MNIKKLWQFTLGGARTPEECEALREIWATDPQKQALLAEFNRGMGLEQRARQGLDVVAGMTADDVVRIYYRHGYLNTWIFHQGDVKMYHKIMWWAEPKRYLALALTGAVILFGGIGLGGVIVKAKAGRDSYGSVKTADLVEIAEECKDRMERFQSTADRRYSDIGEVPSAEWVAEQTKDQPWMKSCGTKCKKGGTYSIALAKDENGREKAVVSCSVHGSSKDVHLGMEEGPEAARLCHHLQVERIVHSFEQPPVPDFRFDELASGNYGCPTTGKVDIVAKRTGKLYDGIGEVVDVSGTKCSLHGNVFECTEHEECIRLNEALAEQQKKITWRNKEREPEICFANQRKIQNWVKSEADGANAQPLSASDAEACPAGGELTVDAIPELWVAHRWNSRIPVLYRVSCSKHGSSPNPAPEDVARLIEYAKANNANMSDEEAARLDKAVLKYEALIAENPNGYWSGFVGKTNYKAFCWEAKDAMLRNPEMKFRVVSALIEDHAKTWTNYITATENPGVYKYLRATMR